jgi:hypothetical protein
VQVIDFTLTLSPTGINPIGTGGINTSTVTVQTIPPTANVNVMVSLAEFVDAGGQVIGTGGHLSHTNNRPLGTLSAMQGTTGANGAFQAVYTAPIFGGQIVVNVSIAGGQTNRAEVVEVRVSGLASLGTGTDYNLVGATTTHPDNHWGTIGAINGLVGIAQDYRTQFYGTNSIPNADRLRYNDISLVLGGKFEIAGDWGNGSHAEHRTGINCDVGSNNVPVARRAALEQIFVQRGSPNFLNEGNHWHLRF